MDEESLSSQQDLAVSDRKQITIPPDVFSDLKLLNDKTVEDLDMLVHMRQFLANHGKQLRDLRKENKELLKKIECTNKKTEQSDSRIQSTRQSLMEGEEKQKKLVEQIQNLQIHLTDVEVEANESITALKKEAKKI